jgi:hypothetical protein
MTLPFLATEPVAGSQTLFLFDTSNRYLWLLFGAGVGAAVAGNPHY